MSFINWGGETPEQKEMRRRYEEEQMLFEQAVRMSRTTGAMAGAAGSGKINPSGLRLTTSETTNYSEFGFTVIDGETIEVTLDWGDGDSITISATGSQYFEKNYESFSENTITFKSKDLAKISHLNIGTNVVSIEGIGLFIGLTGFNFRNSLLTDINQLLEQLPNSIDSLAIYQNYQLTQFVPTVSLPSSLTNLFISDCAITNLSIDLPPSVLNLTISYVPLSEYFDVRIPANSLLYYITIQNISEGITSFTLDLSAATSLYQLYLTNINRLSLFDPSAPLPESLDSMYIAYCNSLTTFNPTYALPNNMRYLYLNNCRLSNFSQYSHALPSNLRGLYLRNNLFSSFNTAFALPNLLDVLDLSFNGSLTNFSPSHALPSSMGALYLGSCSLSSFTTTLPDVYLANFAYNVITNLTLSGLGNRLGEFYAGNNRLNSSQIEGILTYLNSVCVSSRYRTIYLQTQSPSANPLTQNAANAKTSLQAKGVYVNTN